MKIRHCVAAYVYLECNHNQNEGVIFCRVETECNTPIQNVKIALQRIVTYDIGVTFCRAGTECIRQIGVIPSCGI